MTVGNVRVFLSGEAVYVCSMLVCRHVFMVHFSVCKFESQCNTQSYKHTQTNTQRRAIPFLFFFKYSSVQRSAEKKCNVQLCVVFKNEK